MELTGQLPEKAIQIEQSIIAWENFALRPPGNFEKAESTGNVPRGACQGLQLPASISCIGFPGKCDFPQDSQAYNLDLGSGDNMEIL